MFNGPHQHHCPVHDENVDCQAVTHCQLPAVAVCFREHPREILEGFILRLGERAEQKVIQRYVVDMVQSMKLRGGEAEK